MRAATDGEAFGGAAFTTRGRRPWAGRAITIALATAAYLVAGHPPVAAAAERVTLGSKAFPESWILGEALAQLARSAGATAVHRSNLGGTEIVYQALRSGAIDAYPEYTGTIAEVIVKSRGAEASALRDSLRPLGIGVTPPLGFNDGYALAVTRATATRLGLTRLSDLARHPELAFGLTHEFLGRADGWPGLARRYGLGGAQVRGIQHELAYDAIAAGRIDVTDIYTTDAEIERLGLVVLTDDRGFFPRYDAVVLYRLDLPRRAPRAWRAMLGLAGAVGEPAMIRANARVVLGHAPFEAAADTLLRETLGGSAAATSAPSVPARILRDTWQHLKLVALALGCAILFGVPLGVVASRSPWLARVTLAAAGVLQTLPSLALLAFLIPLLGIGVTPALVALFLYGLLPIVRNTYTGLATLPPSLIESVRALGLSGRTRLFGVELPLASPAILAGIKTSAVITVGTATLAALIGAGGLGDPILSGIQLRRDDLILEGAIPAAALALLVQGAFDLLERWVVPKGLRLRGEGG